MLASSRSVARLAGALYVVGSLGFVVGMVARSSLIGHGDAVAIAGSLRSSELLVRSLIAMGMASSAAWVFAVIALHRLLEHVSRPVAASMVLLVVLAVVLECLGLAALYAALGTATGNGQAGGVGQSGSAATVVPLVALQQGASLLASFFWGLWLLPLGYLVMKSRIIPWALGAFLILGGSSLLANVFLIVVVGRGFSLLIGLDVGELFFVVWLIGRGVQAGPERVQAGRGESKLAQRRV